MDGVKRKIAIIVNGDTEARHTGNVDKAMKALHAKGYECFVASTERPAGLDSKDTYVRATSQNIDALIAKAREKLDGDDELVIYTTGHGSKLLGTEHIVIKRPDGMNSNCKKLFSGLDQLKYARRVVVMDQCYSGGMARLFTDDPKTLFMSAGSSDETVCCGQFAPRLWASDDVVPDINKDGVISWKERYSYAEQGVIGGGLNSIPQFVTTEAFEDDGTTFEQAVVQFNDKATLEKRLDKLKPGQYAVVTFSMERCGGCLTYSPQFDKMAIDGGGEHQWLRTENTKVGNDFGVSGFPTVVIFGAKDKVGKREMHVIKDRKNVPEYLKKLKLGSDDSVAAVEKIDDPHRRAEVLARMALIQSCGGDRQKAINLFERALEGLAPTALDKDIATTEAIIGIIGGSRTHWQNRAFGTEGYLQVAGCLEKSDLGLDKIPLFIRLIEKADELGGLQKRASYLKSISESLTQAGLGGDAMGLFNMIVEGSFKTNRTDTCGTFDLGTVAGHIAKAGLGNKAFPLLYKLILEADKQGDYNALPQIANAVIDAGLEEKYAIKLLTDIKTAADKYGDRRVRNQIGYAIDRAGYADHFKG